jgi:hypothetical protein
MQALIIVLLVVLIAAVVYFGLQASANKSEVALPAPLDTDAIARTVQTAINSNQYLARFNNIIT